MERQERVYRNRWLVDLVCEMVGQASTEVTRTDKLEKQVYTQLGKYLSLNENHIRNKRHLRRLIAREISQARKRYGKQIAVSIDVITNNDDEGNVMEYEPKDDLAIVGAQALEIKETVNLLAKADRRREMILNEWLYGNTDETDISRILADTLGGNARSHCRFVQRFKIECRNQLTASMAI